MCQECCCAGCISSRRCAVSSDDFIVDEPFVSTKDQLTKPTPFMLVQGDSFMEENIPPRKVLLRTISKREPICFAQSINQIFAWRGVGKTCLGFGLMSAFATGGRFLNWEVPER